MRCLSRLPSTAIAPCWLEAPTSGPLLSPSDPHCCSSIPFSPLYQHDKLRLPENDLSLSYISSFSALCSLVFPLSLTVFSFLLQDSPSFPLCIFLIIMVLRSSTWALYLSPLAFFLYKLISFCLCSYFTVHSSICLHFSLCSFLLILSAIVLGSVIFSRYLFCHFSGCMTHGHIMPYCRFLHSVLFIPLLQFSYIKIVTLSTIQAITYRIIRSSDLMLWPL